MDPEGKEANHVKALCVRELGKNLNFKFSCCAKFPASISNLATCSTVDSLDSPENLVNFGIFVPHGISVSRTNSFKGEVKVGLRVPIFTPFCTRIFSTI